MGVVRQELRAVDHRARGGRSSSILGVPGARLTVEPGFPGRVTVKTPDGDKKSLRRIGTPWLLAAARRRFGVVPEQEVLPGRAELAKGIPAATLTRFRLETTARPEDVAVGENQTVRGYGVQVIEPERGRWYVTPVGDPTQGPRRAMQAVADAFRLEKQTA
jgi:hypothetical protein